MADYGSDKSTVQSTLCRVYSLIYYFITDAPEECFQTTDWKKINIQTDRYDVK